MLLPCELLDDQRNERRSIMDALEVLRTKANFGENDEAGVWLGGLRLPSNEIVHLMCISFESTIHEKKLLVSLPTTNRFKARFEGKPESQEFEIAMLEGATINSRGHVRLSNGDQIRAVEVTPALLPYTITKLDWAVVRHTIAAINIENHCEYDPGNIGSDNPFRGLIDCSKLSGHPAPLLKEIQARIQNDESGFGTVSQQKIADTLRKFEMRMPANRPSSRSGLARAND